MTDSADISDEVLQKRSRLPLILAIVVAFIGGASGFLVTFNDLIGGTQVSENEEEKPSVNQALDVVFVALEPMVVSINEGERVRQLRFTAHLEVDGDSTEGVTALSPRILDVLNTYLRAVDLEMLEDRRALIQLRSHMLHRIQMVVGQGVVRDLLITEFVLV